MQLILKDSKTDRPDHGKMIMYADTCDTRYPQFKFGEVEYQWDDGDGNLISYNSDEFIEGYELKVIVDGWDMPRFLWIYVTDWHDMFNEYDEEEF